MNNEYFYAAMYLRLSRDDRDAGVAAESNSIGNQRELIKSYIHEHENIDLYDIYVDDGFTGSNFDRPEFKRMMGDIESGKVNCVIVKDLSRFGRDYIESGHYIQKLFPSLGVRFIAITDCYDSLVSDTSERTIVLPVKNFINDSYCRDISIKVKSQFEVKRKNGEYISAFAPYGYRKDKNNLVIDEYAAQIVKWIFDLKIDGMAVSAIAKRLNESGILSPREYKKFIGSNYKGGFYGAARSMWSSSTVKRILTNEMYLGHLIQGKTERINYKIKKSVQKPKEDWVKVENTHESIISKDKFFIVQNLLKSDSRISPVSREVSLFTGILFCGDCGEQMIRRVNRCKNTQKVYYICAAKNRGEGCTRHSIEEEKLKELICESIRKYANCFMEKIGMFQNPVESETDFKSIFLYDTETAKLKNERNKYYSICLGLYDDLRRQVINKDEFERLHSEFKKKAAGYETARRKHETIKNKLSQNGEKYVGRLKDIRECLDFKEIDRHTLCSMVKKIIVYEDKRIEIVFYFSDGCHTINERREGNERQ